MSVAVIACGALAAHVHEIADRRNLTLRIEPINPLLHNRPEGIAPEVEKMILELQPTHDRVAIAYADCGTYGALDELCDKYQVSRLSGDHCYDVFATAEKMKAEFEAVPGTYVFTDYLVKTFRRSVMTEMGLDRYPELRDDYFHSYKRVLWLAQHQTPELEAAAKEKSCEAADPTKRNSPSRILRWGCVPRGSAKPVRAALAGPLSRAAG
jgi:hypothetical protein